MAISDIYERRREDASSGATNGCPECGGNTQSTAVETTCVDCGLVLEATPVDHGPEWRSFADDGSDPKRTGAPLTPTRHDRGISTEIGQKTDGRGNTLSGKKRRQLHRLRREHSRGRWRCKAERNLAMGLTEVRRMTSALGLADSIRDQACSLFRSAQDADLLQGRSIDSMASAGVYAACRCNGLPVGMGQVADVSKVSRERVENAYRVVNQELGIPAVPPSPKEYVPRLASSLELTDETRLLGERLAKRANERGIANGCNPAGVAAGCLYVAGQERGEAVTQRELAEAADVSRMTVGKQSRTLRDMR